MRSQDQESFRSALDANYQWPAAFPFKFIVPEASAKEFLALFPELLVHKQKPSSGGKYVSISFHLHMQSSQQVLDIYARAAQHPGLIAL